MWGTGGTFQRKKGHQDFKGTHAEMKNSDSYREGSLCPRGGSGSRRGREKRVNQRRKRRKWRA